MQTIWMLLPVGDKLLPILYNYQYHFFTQGEKETAAVLR